MPSYIIVTRNPTTKNLMVIIDFVGDDDMKVTEFNSEDEAENFAKTLTICKAWGCEIIPIEFV